MKKQQELSRELADLIKDTNAGKIHWNVEVQTTETNPAEEKPTEMEDGVLWTLDECYVSYYCNYKGKDFCMITYELIKTAAGKTVTSNMVFVPPLGIRFFDLRTLLPHSMETSAVLLGQIHQLWVMILAMYKANPESVSLNVSPGVLTIED